MGCKNKSACAKGGAKGYSTIVFSGCFEGVYKASRTIDRVEVLVSRAVSVEIRAKEFEHSTQPSSIHRTAQVGRKTVRLHVRVF